MTRLVVVADDLTGAADSAAPLTRLGHGTAFDIAGTGRAEGASMVEALRQAADLAPTEAP